MTSTFWDDDPSRAERCKQLWAEGHSAGVIAGLLGTSRSSVLSKINRSGWSGPQTRARLPYQTLNQRDPPNKLPRRTVRRRTLRRHPLAGTTENQPLPEPRDDDASRSLTGGAPVPLASLERGQCRWPIGHPGDPWFGFCGAGKLFGTSYCEIHFRLAHQPAQPRRIGGFR
jgi:GcrA cell cycle regulator